MLPTFVLLVAYAGPPGVVVNFAPAQSQTYLGSPALAILPNGDYAVSHDFFGPGSTRDTTCVFASDDFGKSWKRRATIRGQWWSSLFVHREALYLMGTTREYGSAVIRKSADGGKTWSASILLDDAPYHCAPVPVLASRGRLWRGMEQFDGPKWGAFRAFMMSAPEDADLMKPSSWTNTNRVRGPHPWLEGNAITTPDGIVNMLRVHQPSFAEVAALVRISADGLTATHDPADVVSFPGGSKKFTVRYDPVSKQYWSLANAVPDAHRLADRRPDQTRNTLSLLRSENLKQWEIVRDVLKHDDAKTHGYQYADWTFDGDDIIAAVRTAFEGPDGTPAHSAHDANYITFHRVPGFRR